MREFSHIVLLRFFGKQVLFSMGFLVIKKTGRRHAPFLSLTGVLMDVLCHDRSLLQFRHCIAVSNTLV